MDNLADATNQVQQEPPDILLFDLSMEGDGDAPHPAELVRSTDSKPTVVIGISSPEFSKPPKEREKLCDRMLFRPLSLSLLREAIAIEQTFSTRVKPSGTN